MATRTKTVRKFFKTQVTSLADNTKRTITGETIFLPENSSRVFKSVVLVYYYQMRLTSSSNDDIDTETIGIKLGAAAEQTRVRTDNMTGTGENFAVECTYDVTSYSVTNFGSGTNQTVEISLQIDDLAGVGSINHGAYLLITYEWDDASQDTRIRTVGIPIESDLTYIPTTLTNIAGLANQIPGLDAKIPEDTIVYREIVVEVHGMNGIDNTTDEQLGIKIGSAAEHLFGLEEAALTSSFTVHYFHDLTGLDTSIAHNIQHRAASGQTDAYPVLRYVLWVTYEYSHTTTVSGSGRVMQSLQMSIPYPGAPRLLAVGRFADLAKLEYLISEPGTITLEQSGIWPIYAGGNKWDLDLKVGAQTARSYVELHDAPRRQQNVGPIQRIDSGSNVGAGITVARGYNEVDVRLENVDTGDAQFSFLLGVMLFLNYTSDIHADGDAVHNHTIHYCLTDTSDTDATLHQYANLPGVNIPEANYYLNDVAYWWSLMQINGTEHWGFGVKGESGDDSPGDSTWRNPCPFLKTVGGEREVQIFLMSVAHLFRRYPQELIREGAGHFGTYGLGKMDVELARDYVTHGGVSYFDGIGMFVTYHAMTWSFDHTMEDTVSPTGVKVKLFRKYSENRLELYAIDDADGSGNFTFIVYDNIANVFFAYAQESATLHGVSILHEGT